MSERKESLYSARVAGGRTTYFVDLRKAVNGRFYLVVTESQRNPDGNFDQKRLTVFEESAGGLLEELGRAVSRLNGLAASRSDEEVEEIRKHHPRAFMKWDSDEEAVLRSMYDEGTDIPRIALRMGRTPAAVTARLDRLGLAPPPAAAEVPGQGAV